MYDACFMFRGYFTQVLYSDRYFRYGDGGRPLSLGVVPPWSLVNFRSNGR